MSCQLKAIAKIVDVQNIKRNLFTNNSSTVVKGDEDDPWNWSVEGESQSKETWLDECHISLSPSEELLVLAQKKVMIILTAKWDSLEESDAKTKYMISWQGDPRKENNEHITCVLCLPVAAQGRQSSQCGADWTCIAVGFSSGAVRFYTETGNLLVSEVLHDDAVVSIKCQCYQPVRYPNETQQMEEIFVMYSNVACCVRGFALCNTLKACRNQLARVQAHCRDRIEAPSLDVLKWSLVDQVSISDMSVLGSQTPVSFSHLATASVRGGFDASYRSSAPHTATVIAAGIRPYIGFHCIVEGSSAPVLSDVAKIVATKLKSAIGQAVPGWLGRSRRNSVPDKAKEKATLEPPEAMTCRFGICDALRHGIKIATCPQRKLSAVSDGLGRVILVDNTSGLAIRMWKGYREAECAFIPVEENKNSSTGRTALYLAIYAPKKGLVEVWAMQQGPKLVTFSVSKAGRLMYISHGLLGVNCLTVKRQNCSQHPCIFIDNCGVISQVIIPFHAILSDKNSKRSKDLHILKQIKRALHSEVEADVKDLCQQLTTDEVCQQALEFLAGSKKTSLDILQYVICLFQEKFSVADSNEEEEPAKCIQACENLQRLFDFYNMVHSLQSQPPKYSTVVPNSPSQSMQDLAQLLKLTDAELQKLTMFISMAGENLESTKVTFQQKIEESFSIFVSCFLQSYTNAPPLTLSKNISQSVLSNIGEVLCQGILYGCCTATEWKEAAEDSKIEPKALLHAATAYWLTKPHGNNLHSELTLFTELSGAICSMTSTEEVERWWPEVRARIYSSENPCNALTASMVMRAVCLTIEEKLTDKEIEWETISEELCAWSQLIAQLEALAHLSVIVCSRRKKLEAPSVPALDHTPSPISLSQILSKGPGSVSEVVAKWIGSWGLNPGWLLEIEVQTPTQPTNVKGSIVDGVIPKVDPSKEAKPTTKEEEAILVQLETLREHFPLSLSPGPLIANLAWEYVLAWMKTPDNIENLSTALLCIKNIHNPHMRQGICSIIWNVHLRNKFESAIKLLHKIGKVPKERLCRQHLNISDENVKHLLANIVNFLKIFIESSSIAESCERTVINREALWTEETQPSLAEVATAQASPNSDLLLVLNQCASALRLLSTFTLHLHRPITNLFDSVGESCLWSDISSYPMLPKHHFEPKLQESRIEFLKKVISAALKPLTPELEEKNIAEAIDWVNQCFALATVWSLSCDTLRIHQVCQLYHRNCDRLAEEIVPAVSDREALGLLLLQIAGQRMKTFLTNSSTLFKERMANLSPSLSAWIYEMDGSRIECDLKDIGHLSSMVISLLPESNANRSHAILLAEAIQPLAA